MTEIVEFIHTNIESVDQMRILLMLRDSPQRDWTAETVCRRLRLAKEDIVAHLAKLAARGLLSKSADLNPLYRYAPTSSNHDNMASRLAELDRERPVTLINLIYANKP